MTEYKSLFLHTLQERGFIHQVTNGEALDALLLDPKGPPTAAYIGFDATAKSLHVGSLVQIMMLRWLQKCGHKPIVLMGGGTTKIGDPSGKDEARPALTDAQIAANLAGIKTVFDKFLRFGDKPTDAQMVNNDDWLSTINYVDFLRKYGRHFSINRMMTMDSVKLRLEREQPLSFLEFNYMLMQAYDFVELHNRYGVRLQMGGSDQWGNIVSGTELHRKISNEGHFNRPSINAKTKEEADKLLKKINSDKFTHEAPKWKDLEDVEDANYQFTGLNNSLFGLTTPLMTTASGAKMGKTASGAVWLNDDMLPAYDYYQFWRNTEDADVGKFLRLFTELPIDEVEGLESLKGADINEAKKILAFEATKLCHGDDAANKAAEAAKQLFEQGAMSTNMPTIEIPAADFGTGIPAYALIHRAGFAASGGDARRLIRGGGGKINDVKIEKEDQLITKDHFVDGSLKLSAGKKHHAKIVIAA